MRFMLLPFVLGAVGTLSCPARASTYFVNPEGTGDFPTIQAAVAAAADGDTIALASGMFTGEGNRDIDLLNYSLIVRSQSGNAEDCVIACEGSPTSPHRGFRLQPPGGSQCCLESFTITGGYHTGRGGAIACLDCSPTLRGMRIMGNEATHGGGLYVEYGNPHLLDCLFQSNIAGEEGGAACALNMSHLEIADCDFIENTSGRRGGAICGSTTATRCTFTGNTAEKGGAVEMGDSFTECLFTKNHAGYGGAMAGAYGFSVTECTLNMNSADTIGGAIYYYSGSAQFVRCTLQGNVAGTDGGAIAFLEATPLLSGCTLADNGSPVGSGIACLWGMWWPCDVTLENTIIAFGMGGSGFHDDSGGSTALTCCDIYGNEGGDWVNTIADQYGIHGNISEDPLFCRDANPDHPLTLFDASPCAAENNPECDQIGTWSIGCSFASLSEDSPGRVLELDPPHPNPFIFVTRFSYRIPQAAHGNSRIAVFDATGRLVRELERDRTMRAAWDATDARGLRVPGGNYFIHLQSDGRAYTRPVVVMN